MHLKLKCAHVTVYRTAATERLLRISAAAKVTLVPTTLHFAERSNTVGIHSYLYPDLTADAES